MNCDRHPDAPATHQIDRTGQMVPDPVLFPIDGESMIPADPVRMCDPCTDELAAYADTLPESDRADALAMLAPITEG